jgi:carbonic anhydrase/acetyltransferase-like protein (isoleucine patch superfamily)
MALIYEINNKKPRIRENVFVAETAVIIGDVEIGDFSSVWYNSVIRGDLDKIKIGRRTNIQDNTVVHVDKGFPVEIGDHVVIGHSAVIHGCTIESNVMVGLRACVLNGAHISENTIVGAGAVVTGKKYPPNSVLMGVPAKVVREITEEEYEREITNRWKEYLELAQIHSTIKKI